MNAAYTNAQTGEADNTSAHIRAIRESRLGVSGSDSDPPDFDPHKEKYGRADNLDDAGYILPSGYALNLHRTKNVVFHEQVPGGVTFMLLHGAMRVDSGWRPGRPLAQTLNATLTPPQITHLQGIVERHGHIDLTVDDSVASEHSFLKHYHEGNLNELDGDLRKLHDGRFADIIRNAERLHCQECKKRG